MLRSLSFSPLPIGERHFFDPLWHSTAELWMAATARSCFDSLQFPIATELLKQRRTKSTKIFPLVAYLLGLSLLREIICFWRVRGRARLRLLLSRLLLHLPSSSSAHGHPDTVAHRRRVPLFTDSRLICLNAVPGCLVRFFGEATSTAERKKQKADLMQAAKQPKLWQRLRYALKFSCVFVPSSLLCLKRRPLFCCELRGPTPFRHIFPTASASTTAATVSDIAA